MHLFDMAAVLIILSLVGVEFSVAAFINPVARRLDPEPSVATRANTFLNSRTTCLLLPEMLSRA